LILRGGAAAVEGVDIDAGAIVQARAAYDHEHLTFGVGDALDRLHRADAESLDVVVAFEALEHLPRLEDVLERLNELAAAGVRMLVSVPNSRTFHEDNEFHVTDFGFDEARAAFDRFPSVSYLFQHIAEGSIILGEGRAQDFAGDVGALAQAEPEYANTFLVAVGFPPDATDAVTAQLNLVATPNHNRFMLELEAANAELFRTNLRLSRGWLGKSDAAAASMQIRFEELRARVVQLEARVVELDGIARHNDELYQRERVRMNAPRYRAVDKLRDGIASIPFLGRILRSGWRGLSGARRRSR
jgi:SAM-dependent methyltransferase